MKPSQVIHAVTRCMAAGVTPFLRSPPGLGKSAIIAQIAKENGLKLIDMRLSDREPTDLQGILFPKDGRATYLPPHEVPIESDPIPEGYAGWILFLDELPNAPRAVQSAAFKLLDRKVGEYAMHPACFIVAAGNRITDGSVVYPLPTPTISRIVHLNMEASLSEWLDWAYLNDIDYRITSYLNFKNESFHRFDPMSSETFPCARTWEMCSKIVNDMPTLSVTDQELIAGIIGVGTAREFIEFAATFGELKTIDEIMANPDTVPMPNRPDLKFAYAGFIANHLTTSNAPVLMKFIERMPSEFQILTLRETVKNNTDIALVPAVMDWIVKVGSVLARAA